MKIKKTAPIVVATLQGVEVILAPHLKANIRRLIRSGDYEKPEIEFGLANLQPGDRVMEMGTGAGIVGSVFIKNIKDLKLQSFEANPDLIEHIRALYSHNGVDHSATVFSTLWFPAPMPPKASISKSVIIFWDRAFPMPEPM